MTYQPCKMPSEASEMTFQPCKVVSEISEASFTHIEQKKEKKTGTVKSTKLQRKIETKNKSFPL